MTPWLFLGNLQKNIHSTFFCGLPTLLLVSRDFELVTLCQISPIIWHAHDFFHFFLLRISLFPTLLFQAWLVPSLFDLDKLFSDFPCQGHCCYFIRLLLLHSSFIRCWVSSSYSHYVMYPSFLRSSFRFSRSPKCYSVWPLLWSFLCYVCHLLIYEPRCSIHNGTYFGCWSVEVRNFVFPTYSYNYLG